MRRKKSRRGRRYTAAEKKRILNTARRQDLTAQQVSKKFGVSPITFYRWRGPVRRSARLRAVADLAQVRRRVREGVQRVLPKVIRQEVNAYLQRVLARAPVLRGRRRRGAKRK